MLSAARAGTWWPLSALLGVLGAAWITVCAVRLRDARLTWLGIAALAAAYAVALASDVEPVDAWTAAVAALLLLTAELSHAAAGTPHLDRRDDPAILGRYARSVVAALLGATGIAALLLAAASQGGSGGAEVTALGAACAAAALALVAATAGRTSTE